MIKQETTTPTTPRSSKNNPSIKDKTRSRSPVGALDPPRTNYK